MKLDGIEDSGAQHHVIVMTEWLRITVTLSSSDTSSKLSVAMAR